MSANEASALLTLTGLAAELFALVVILVSVGVAGRLWLDVTGVGHKLKTAILEAWPWAEPKGRHHQVVVEDAIHLSDSVDGRAADRSAAAQRLRGGRPAPE